MRRHRGATQLLLLAAAAGLLLAAAGHIAAAQEHTSMGGLHQTAFLLAAAGQITVAFLLIARPSAATVAAALGFTVATVTAWTASRTVGLPGFGSAEGVGSLDSMVVVAEIMVVASLAIVVQRRRTTASHAIAAPAVAVLMVLAVAAGPGATAQGAHHADVSSAGSEGTHADLGSDEDHPPAADHMDGVHLHGLGGPDADPGADPARKVDAALDATSIIGVGELPSAVHAAGTYIWVANRGDGSLTRVVEATRAGVRTFEVGGSPSALVSSADSLWVADFSRDQVMRINPSSGRVTGRVNVGPGPAALVLAGNALWVSSVQEGTIQRIDIRTLQVSAPVAVGFGPIALATTPGVVWVLNALDHTVVPVDARTRSVGEPVVVPSGAVDLLSFDGRLWVASSSAGSVSVIDPDERVVVGDPITVDRVTDAGMGPTGLTASGGTIYVANNHDKTIHTIDANTRQLGAPLFFSNELGSGPIAVRATATPQGVWVTDFDADALAYFATGRIS